MIFIIAILIILYFISIGATEGYTWASKERRIQNGIIRGNDEGFGMMDYHSWRFFETLLIFVISVYLFGISGIGLFLIGLFLFERVLNKVTNDNWFKSNGWVYHIAGLEFKRYKRQDWLILITGIILWSI